MPFVIEYRVEQQGGPVALEWLNELGAQGWEVAYVEPNLNPLTGTFDVQRGRVWLFKRVHMEHPSIVEALPISDGAGDPATAVARQIADDIDDQFQCESLQTELARDEPGEPPSVDEDTKRLDREFVPEVNPSYLPVSTQERRPRGRPRKVHNGEEITARWERNAQGQAVPVLVEEEVNAPASANTSD